MNGYDLLKHFPDFTVCSGHKGLARNVSTVTVMDAPDIYNWMKGNEFLITSGYPFKDSPEDFAQLLIKLKEKNVTALGIKINRFIKKLPKIVIDTSNEINLPIIYIPDHYAFSDIINPSLTAIVNEQYNELVKSEKIHQEFIKMGIHNTEINNVLERLQRFIKKDLAYLNIKDSKLYSKPDTFFKKTIEDSYNKNIDNIPEHMYLHEVKDTQGIHGYIIVNSRIEDLTSLDLRTIEYAQMMINFHLQKQISNRQIIKSYKDNFVLDLLLNNIKSNEEVFNRANIYNWNLGPNMFCIIIDIDNYKLNYKNKNYNLNLEEIGNMIYKDVIVMMKNINKDSYYMTKSDSIVYIVNYKEKNLIEFERSLLEICEEIKIKHSYSLTIAIGNRYESIRDIHKSYKEALICLNQGRDLMNISDNIINYSDISIYWNLLESLKNNDYKNDPLVSKLKKLKYSDSINDTEYYNSIKSIISNDWNLKKASTELYVHYNTMKYRFSKIKELLGDNLDNRASKLKLELALHVIEIS